MFENDTGRCRFRSDFFGPGLVVKKRAYFGKVAIVIALCRNFETNPPRKLMLYGGMRDHRKLL
jgi:hypothetical protein